MKRNYRLLTVVAAAAITFASLMIYAGPERFTKNLQHYHGWHDCDHKEVRDSKMP